MRRAGRRGPSLSSCNIQKSDWKVVSGEGGRKPSKWCVSVGRGNNLSNISSKIGTKGSHCLGQGGNQIFIRELITKLWIKHQREREEGRKNHVLVLFKKIHLFILNKLQRKARETGREGERAGRGRFSTCWFTPAQSFVRLKPGARNVLWVS